MLRGNYLKAKCVTCELLLNRVRYIVYDLFDVSDHTI